MGCIALFFASNKPNTMKRLTTATHTTNDSKTIQLFMVTKNSADLLPEFLRHYRRIGVEAFYIIDNASTDHTRDILQQQPDVSLFLARGNFAKNRCGVRWLNTLINRYSRNTWCLVVDSDELFIYPFYETMPLQTFCQYLDQHDYQATYALMMDVYDRGKPIAQLTADFTHLYYDPIDTHQTVNTHFFPYHFLKGGPRNRVFFPNQPNHPASPCLSKIPLIKPKRGFQYVNSTHNCTPLKLADLTCVLVHFKLTEQFHQYTHQQTYQQERVCIELYERYHQTLSQTQKPIEYFDAQISQPIEGSTHLMQSGLFGHSSTFDQFCKQHDLMLPTHATAKPATIIRTIHSTATQKSPVWEQLKTYAFSQVCNVLYRVLPWKRRLRNWLQQRKTER